METRKHWNKGQPLRYYLFLMTSDKLTKYKWNKRFSIWLIEKKSDCLLFIYRVIHKGRDYEDDLNVVFQWYLIIGQRKKEMYS